jgi:nucleoside-diphosphate-sugar epimerase
MRILVTGAAGFIGYHTSERLIAQGHEVIGFDNLNPYYDVSLKEARLLRLARHKSFHFIKADLGDRTAVEATFAEEKPSRVMCSKDAGTMVLSISSMPRRARSTEEIAHSPSRSATLSTIP